VSQIRAIPPFAFKDDPTEIVETSSVVDSDSLIDISVLKIISVLLILCKSSLERNELTQRRRLYFVKLLLLSAFYQSSFQDLCWLIHSPPPQIIKYD